MNLNKWWTMNWQKVDILYISDKLVLASLLCTIWSLISPYLMFRCCFTRLKASQITGQNMWNFEKLILINSDIIVNNVINIDLVIINMTINVIKTVSIGGICIIGISISIVVEDVYIRIIYKVSFICITTLTIVGITFQYLKSV